jgi:hypothetical protein
LKKTVEDRILSRIYGNGRGWAFSQADFADLGSRSAVDSTLHRREKEGLIRRVLRGIYDYPRYSALLGQTVSPDLDQAAHALARKFAWRIQPDGATAQNLLGLSTQVPARVVYLSDGPDRSYSAGTTKLSFEHTALKEAGFKLPESGLVVQALKALGERRVTPSIIEQIRAKFDPGFVNAYSSTQRPLRAGSTRRSRRLRKSSLMDRLARTSARDRSDLFTEAAAKLGIRPTIVEKDFWVCFTLNLLFTKSRYRDSLVFKGGTSLSKVYGLIERFSEDIDLVLDWKLIGFGEGLRDPMQAFESKTKQDRFNKQIDGLAAAFIANTLCPELDRLAREENVGLSATVGEADSHIVNIRYPAAFSEAYIRPEVQLEIGPLASWVPSAPHTVRPYAFDVFPQLFVNPHLPGSRHRGRTHLLGEGHNSPPGGASRAVHTATAFQTLLRSLQTLAQPRPAERPDEWVTP